MDTKELIEDLAKAARETSKALLVTGKRYANQRDCDRAYCLDWAVRWLKNEHLRRTDSGEYWIRNME